MSPAILWCLLVVSGLLLAWGFARLNRSRGYPWSTFLFDPRVRFSDLTTAHRLSHRERPYALQDGSALHTPYFPLYVWAMRLLSGRSLVALYRGTYLALAATFSAMVGLPWWAAVVLMGIGYPVLFADDRGNVDHIVTMLAGIGIALLFQGHPYWGGLLLAIATATKGYSAPFYMLWLLRGEYGSLAVSGAAVAALCLLPGRSFGGGILATVRAHRANLAVFHRVGVLAEMGPVYSTCHYCCDAFSAIRLLSWWRGMDFDAAKFVRPYLAFSTAWAILLAMRAATTDQAWIAVMALGLVQVVWPHVANDYKLTVLIPGIALWLIAGAPGIAVLACIAALWVPKHYWFPSPGSTKASISCAVSPVILAALTGALWI